MPNIDTMNNAKYHENHGRGVGFLAFHQIAGSNPVAWKKGGIFFVGFFTLSMRMDLFYEEVAPIEVG